MYSFLIQASPRGVGDYQFFTYRGTSPVSVHHLGKEHKIESGCRFGVRPSQNGRFMRLVVAGDTSRVFALTLDQAKKLAAGVGHD